MITADRIRKLSYLDTQQVEQAVRKNYPKDSFVSTKFLGITNGGQFCYSAIFIDEGNERCTTKVFVDLDANEQPVGEY